MKRSKFIKTLGAGIATLVLLPQLSLSAGDGKYRVIGASFSNTGPQVPSRPHFKWVRAFELSPGHIVEDRAGNFLRYEGDSKFLNLA